MDALIKTYIQLIDASCGEEEEMKLSRRTTVRSIGRSKKKASC